MNFCSHCAAPVRLEKPKDDNRLRYVCVACHAIHYQNPRIIVGCIPEWQNQILMCRRSIEPRHGLWTVPAGFMENGETVEQGAMRETLEEANARVDIIELFTLCSVSHINQVLLLFRAQLLDLDFYPGHESLETRLMSAEEIPWDQLAFTMIKNSLHHYFNDRKQGHFQLHRQHLP
jgi:ADP-ribose pyrophosphatase YjhB (NUDIX family)